MSYIVLLITILCIVGSVLWSSGSILLLDYLATPHGEVSVFMSGWYMFPQVFATLFGVNFGTKLFFVAILIVSAYL